MEIFKSEINIVKNFFGSRFLEFFIENTDEYSDIRSSGSVETAVDDYGVDISSDSNSGVAVDGKLSILKWVVFKKFSAVLFLRGSNQAHYGKLTLEYCKWSEVRKSF